MKLRSLVLATAFTAALGATSIASADSGSTYYVGSANGGVWKTMDGAQDKSETGMLVPAVQKVRCASRYC